VAPSFPLQASGIVQAKTRSSECPARNILMVQPKALLFSDLRHKRKFVFSIRGTFAIRREMHSGKHSWRNIAISLIYPVKGE
jgi:hypothetical protein